MPATPQIDWEARFVKAKEAFLNGLPTAPAFPPLVGTFAEASNDLVESRPNDAANLGWRKSVLETALKGVDNCLSAFPDAAVCHKWKAVISAKYGDTLSLKERIRNSFNIQHHALSAAAIDPDDAITLHVLGAFCYSIATISRIERAVASTLFASPPKATLEDAEFFLRAADIVYSSKFSLNVGAFTSPRFLRNDLLLGQTQLALGRLDAAADTFAICGSEPATMLAEADQIRECRKAFYSLRGIREPKRCSAPPGEHAAHVDPLNDGEPLQVAAGAVAARFAEAAKTRHGKADEAVRAHGVRLPPPDDETVANVLAAVKDRCKVLMTGPNGAAPAKKAGAV